MSRTIPVKLVALAVLALCIRSSLGSINPASHNKEYKEEAESQKRMITWLWEQLDQARQCNRGNDSDLTQKLASVESQVTSIKKQLDEQEQEGELQNTRMETIEQKAKAQNIEIEGLKNECEENKQKLQEQGEQIEKLKKLKLEEKDSANIQARIKALEPFSYKDCGDVKELSPGASSGVYTVYKGVLRVATRVYCDMEAKKGGWTEHRYKDCRDVQEFNPGAPSGVYIIYTGNLQVATRVYCDMDTQKGGWTIILSRFDGSVSFNLEWRDLQSQVGELSGEHWIGLDAIHRVTSQGLYELLVELEGHKEVVFALYDRFWIEGVKNKYKLHVSGYNKRSTVGDSFSWHNGCGFSARDVDNDADSTHCAQHYKGAWWYKTCHLSNLLSTYRYTKENRGVVTSFANSMVWSTFAGAAKDGYYHALKAVSMKVRRV